MTAAFTFLEALAIFGAWCLIALPLAVLIGRCISLGERVESKPGYLIPPAEETARFYTRREDEHLPR